jgi:osmotically-inducible protein OsmY
MALRTKFWSHTAAAGTGALAMYYLDPDRGRARRARSRDMLLAAGRDMTEEAEKRSRYYEGRLEGAQARLAGRGRLHPVDDHVVKQGIRQQLSSAGVDMSDVVIDVTDGVVGLRGKASTDSEIRKIELEVMTVPGVEEVRSWLHLPGEDAPNKALSIRADAPS